MMIEVVSAVIIRKGRILLTQRPEGKDFPLAWESPGGKVDGNESHHAALKRELAEELGILVEIPAHQGAIWTGKFNNPFQRAECKEIFLLMYPVQLDMMKLPKLPVPHEGQGIGWFTSSEMRSLLLTPGNFGACTTLERWIKRSL